MLFVACTPETRYPRRTTRRPRKTLQGLRPASDFSAFPGRYGGTTPRPCDPFLHPCDRMGWVVSVPSEPIRQMRTSARGILTRPDPRSPPTSTVSRLAHSSTRVRSPQRTPRARLFSTQEIARHAPAVRTDPLHPHPPVLTGVVTRHLYLRPRNFLARHGTAIARSGLTLDGRGLSGRSMRILSRHAFPDIRGRSVPTSLWLTPAKPSPR